MLCSGILCAFLFQFKHIILSYFNLVRGYSQIFNGFLLHYSFARIQTTTQEVFYIVWCVCWCDFGKKNTGVLFKGIYSIARATKKTRFFFFFVYYCCDLCK